MHSLADAPAELQIAVQEFWPAEQWDNAVSISWLESGWSAFAENDTTDNGNVPCGTVIDWRDGVAITAEHSVSWFAINVCNFPNWPVCYLFNTRHNAGTAHALWASRGWWPWFYSARALGLL